MIKEGMTPTFKTRRPHWSLPMNIWMNCLSMNMHLRRKEEILAPFLLRIWLKRRSKEQRRRLNDNSYHQMSYLLHLMVMWDCGTIDSTQSKRKPIEDGLTMKESLLQHHNRLRQTLSDRTPLGAMVNMLTMKSSLTSTRLKSKLFRIEQHNS